MMNKYILVNKTPREEPDFITWALWFENANRTVKEDTIGNVRVSTVFLGIDYRFGSGPPLLFETMVFGGALHGEIDRYTKWKKAKQGHQAMVERVQATNLPPAYETTPR